METTSRVSSKLGGGVVRAAPWEPSPVLSRAPSLGKEVGVLASLSDRGGGVLGVPGRREPPDMFPPCIPEGTPYAGGLFRMKLLLGKDFPASPPKGYFLTKIFHPNVGANGEICVNVLKRDWTAELGIRHVLLVGSAPGLPPGRLSHVQATEPCSPLK